MSLIDPDSEAARYIKGLDRRLSDIENSPEQDGAVNLIRASVDTAVCSDSVSAEVDESGAFYKYPNFFSPSGNAFSVGYWHSDLTQDGESDGFSDVATADTSGSTGNIFTGEFVTSDFPHYASSGSNVYLAFAAKWDALPTWEYPGTWVQQPAPSTSSYQVYVLASDGQNTGSEYFRLYYDGTEGGTTAKIADPIVWKQYGSNQNSAVIAGTSLNRSVDPRPFGEWNFTEWQ